MAETGPDRRSTIEHFAVRYVKRIPITLSMALAAIVLIDISSRMVEWTPTETEYTVGAVGAFSAGWLLPVLVKGIKSVATLWH